MEDRITRARQLLKDIHLVAIATTNANSTPHNSPVFAAFDGELNAFWSSHPQSTHSKNIGRTGQAFLVLFDSSVARGGLYIQATAGELKPGPDLDHAYNTLEQLKAQQNSTMGDISRFSEPSSQRIYRTTPVKFWINTSDRDSDGLILRDYRKEVTLEQLLS